MIKVVPAGLPDAAPPTLVKVSSRGLVGVDRASLLKRSSSSLLDQVDRVECRPGEHLVHLTALGATEFYGPNRNGDGFSVDACRRTHDTFTKHAHWFREHQNSDPRKSYGVVRASAYNEDMHRIELLVALNGTKEAAQRNGGLVADEEMEKLASNECLSVSMSCKVPFDLCVCCGNRARNRSEYCRGYDEGGSCPGGGAFRKLGTVTADGTQLYVDNTEPTFFDISKVHRPADRIAYTSGVVKSAASFPKLVGGAELAEQYGLTDDPVVLSKPDDRVLPLLRKLAAIEDELAGSRHADNLAFSPTVRGVVDWTAVPFGALLKAAAHRRVLLPLDGFVAAAGGSQADAYAAHAVLPATFRTLAASPPAKLAAAVAVSVPGRYGSPDADRLVFKAAADYSLDPVHVARRVRLASLYAQPQSLRFPAKIASAVASDTAAAYAAYQIATLLATTREEFFCKLVVRQNAV